MTRTGLVSPLSFPQQIALSLSICHRHWSRTDTAAKFCIFSAKNNVWCLGLCVHNYLQEVCFHSRLSVLPGPECFFHSNCIIGKDLNDKTNFLTCTGDGGFCSHWGVTFSWEVRPHAFAIGFLFLSLGCTQVSWWAQVKGHKTNRLLFQQATTNIIRTSTGSCVGLQKVLLWETSAQHTVLTVKWFGET